MGGSKCYTVAAPGGGDVNLNGNFDSPSVWLAGVWWVGPVII